MDWTQQCASSTLSTGSWQPCERPSLSLPARDVPFVGSLQPFFQRHALRETGQVSEARDVEQFSIEPCGPLRMEDGAQRLAGYLQDQVHDVLDRKFPLSSDVDWTVSRATFNEQQDGFDCAVHVQIASKRRTVPPDLRRLVV